MTAPDLSRLDLTSLAWMATVARLRGFRRAAEALGVEQSAVSRRVRGLEDHLGVSLFHRQPRGVVPTHAGRAFLKSVDAVLVLLAEAAREAQAAGRGQRGRLRIGLTTTFIADVLLRLLASFQGAHPKVRIEMVDGTAQDQLTALIDRRIDIAVLPGGMAVCGLDVSELWREPLTVALPRSHPLQDRDAIALTELLADHVLASARDLDLDLLARLGRVGTSALDLEVVDAAVPILVGLTRLKRGVSVMTAGAAAALHLPDDVVLRAMSADVGTVPYAVTWSASNDNPALRRFVSAARVMRPDGVARPAIAGG
ncbi:MAG: LysR family transcriptional regulator [Brevundimonas sp.]|uniref:LysR family transcriptional regulator n=1 Tax=Brevundimonas sp. TaxID=1871086 RepID=UPI002734969E|nr:LysR family transcriptional regulator [Brevundimonas sp.]MDP3404812.1 LysR family transcriptional regulator [Brevundimonas sp.]